MAFPNNTLQIFDVESRQFPAWSKRLSESLPFTHTHDPILGVTFDPAAPNASTVTPVYSHAVFWGSTWICQVNLDGSSANTSAKKRRRENKKSSVTAPPMGPSYTTPTEKVDVSLGDPSQDSKMITHFRPILCVDFLSDGELVVVERPLVDILINLPPAYFRQKYGAS
jgi:U3 small nucleolar RNA-associated protein 4